MGRGLQLLAALVEFNELNQENKIPAPHESRRKREPG